jgi:hypothetical protein
MKNNFTAFILSHGRPDNVITFEKLKSHGYTGRIIIVIDNEDKTAEKYYKNFGKENVVMFDKKEMSNKFDQVDNFDNRKTIVYARNACFYIAKDLGIDNFIQLDDDYYWFGHRTKDGAKTTRSLDSIFSYLVDFVNETQVTTVCFSQGGDHIGGFDDSKKIRRKAMNSFVCSSKKPFSFIGRINEDVNTYTKLGSLGNIFFTINNIQLDQKDTQANNGGMTDVYLIGGTYIKSFYSVIVNPSCVKVKTITAKHTRMHHHINWNNAVPCIIDEKYKKY